MLVRMWETWSRPAELGVITVMSSDLLLISLSRPVISNTSLTTFNPQRPFGTRVQISLIRLLNLMVNFKCRLDWATWVPRYLANILSEYICEGVSGRNSI